ncbi:sigma 54-interacting transcriptional regulator [Fimbriiglobus ruber]|uniref:Formate hydrogenlyase transcriptional activator n=1 Tax=Fimbriiglobus ruber TaxID=1908690 RepID=A0A225E590_9BACT|nr:sigma 54-interacting transcriptional regulator [Fimbriiglobus ruber]OWK43587.1 Formate hydrogenlyase transcriptional activator [Fimbriiglobus ruber]
MSPHDVPTNLGPIQALLGVAESVTADGDPATLLQSVATRLRSAVPFDFLGVLIHDPAAGLMRLTLFVSADPGRVHPCPDTTPLDSPGGLVWQTQEPMLISDLRSETRFPAMQPIWERFGMQSAYYVPLTTARRKLGTIFFAREDAHTHESDELELLRFAARQAAVAIDNALVAADVARLQDELRAERDRLQLLLDVTTAVVAHLDLRGLFRAIASVLRRVVPVEYASLALHDPVRNGWDLHALDFPTGKGGYLRESLHVPFAGAPASLAFTARAPVALTRDELQAMSDHAPVARALVAEGIRHWCCVPILSRDRVLGTVNVGRIADQPFTPVEREWLDRVSGPVGLAVENALAFRQIEELKNKLAAEKHYLEDEIRTEHGFAEIVGASPGLGEVLKQVEVVAPVDTAVLILGETGTGKELVARAIHRLSKRAGRTFVKLNCAAIPTGLLESELFGHEKGAFTGAVARKVGRFELADGGTLFLDEVGDVQPDLQPKLLRVLQEQEFERLGGTRTLRTDVRVIAATNRDLGKMVASGQFRADLFYRLNVFPVRLPALRERLEDIPLLVRYFVAESARKLNRPVRTIPDAAIEKMVKYPWPGNVRELQNFIERCVLLSPGTELRVPANELPDIPPPATSGGVQTLVEAEREHIRAALAAAKGKVGGPGGAAARLGMKRTTLQSKMKKLGVTLDDPPGDNE